MSMFCSRCGGSCAATDAFCAHCGTAVAAAHAPAARRGVWYGVAAVVVLALVGAAAFTVPWRRTPPAGAAAGAAHFSIDTASPSVLTLLCYDKDGKLTAQGSGFVVGRTGVAVTNWHVAERAATMTATNGAGRVFKITGYLNVDAGTDLVLLQLANQDGSAVKDLAEVHFADSRTVAAGQKVFTLSTPEGLSQTLTDGLLSAVRSFKQQQYLQISAPVSHGSSGGPVFNESGEVVGVIKGLLSSGENLNFAIPIDSVVRLLNAPPAIADQRSPGSSASAFDRALAAFNDHHYDVAAKLFAAEAVEKPEHGEAAFNAGLAFVNTGEIGTATDYFRRFLALAEPDDDGIPVAKNWIAAYAASLVPEPAEQHAGGDEEIVMARNSNIFHRPDCALLARLNVTHFKRSQIGPWATACPTCRPAQ